MNTLEQKNLTSKLPIIYNQRCENCGSAKIECRRRVPFGDIDTFVRRGKCTELIQFKSTKQMNDKLMWQSLTVTKFSR